MSKFYVQEHNVNILKHENCKFAPLSASLGQDKHYFASLRGSFLWPPCSIHSPNDMWGKEYRSGVKIYVGKFFIPQARVLE